MDSCTIKTFDALSNKFRDQIREIESRRPAQVQFVVKQKPVRVDKTRGVFGIHKLAPVDKAAAMMLAKSRWNNPPEEKKPDTLKPAKAPKKKPRKKKKALVEIVIDIPSEVHESGLLSIRDACLFLNI